MRLTVGLLCDSFPPLVDGVAQVMLNYAKMIENKWGHCVVVTPDVPDAVDDYPFPVHRIPSVASIFPFDYRMGVPFWPPSLKRLLRMDMDLMHVHSPFVTMTLARMLRRRKRIPIIITYHTKFMYEFDKYLRFKSLRDLARKYVLSNINAADEVWAVSRGAAEDLRSLGYMGGYVVMENGTDFSGDMASYDDVRAIDARFALHPDQPVLLFVGRMMWYKNIGKILDALALLRQKDFPMQMIFVGDGVDRVEIENRVSEMGLDGMIHFAGMVEDRNVLAAYYKRADLMVFPSVFDNAPIVVREAVACGCPCLLARGSSSAEGVEDRVTGFLADDNVDSIAETIEQALSNRELLRRVGLNARKRMYLPWEKVIEKVWNRYEIVCRLHAERYHDKMPQKEIS